MVSPAAGSNVGVAYAKETLSLISYSTSLRTSSSNFFFKPPGMASFSTLSSTTYLVLSSNT
jgi:hypothetical protein